MAAKGNIFEPADFESIIRRLQTLRPDSERRWGKMDPHQMIVHCSDPVREMLGIRPTRNLSSLLLRTVGKWMALYGPEWQKGKFPTSPDYDQHKKGTPPTSLEEDRNELLRLLQHTHRLPEKAPLAPHPAFGPLTRREWGRLAYRHLDHHLRQFGC
jgi:hypothetical protein